MIYWLKMSPAIKRIVVIGAGVVGLSTAICIQEKLPDCHVTIMADKTFQETTSSGAAGIFRPTKEKTPCLQTKEGWQWVEASWRHLSALAESPLAGIAGVSIISGYHFLDQPKEDPLLSKIVYNFRHLTKGDLNSLSTHNYKYGWFYTTILCECRRYLPYLTNRFLDKGGTFIRKKIHCFSEVSEKYDLIVNCSGIESRQLNRDEGLYPVRGHLLRVSAPWIKHFYYKDECYVIPGQDNLIIGGTRQTNDYGLDIRKDVHKKIWKNACQLLPSLKYGTLQEDWVGLRPYRDIVNVSKQIFTSPEGKKIHVVHNYGHGAEGVTLAWGTAEHAARLVQQAQVTSSKL